MVQKIKKIIFGMWKGLILFLILFPRVVVAVPLSGANSDVIFKFNFSTAGWLDDSTDANDSDPTNTGTGPPVMSGTGYDVAWPGAVSNTAPHVAYIGTASTKFSTIVFNVMTATTDSASTIGVGTVQYWNGTAWTSITGGSSPFKTTGVKTYALTDYSSWQSTWQITTVNTVSGYYIRFNSGSNNGITATRISQISVNTSSCGDNIVNGSETCDGGSQICTTVANYSGTQSCNASCTWNTCSSSSSCGDGVCNTVAETFSLCPDDCPLVSVPWDQMLATMMDNTIVNAVNDYGTTSTATKRLRFDRPVLFTNGSTKVSIPNNLTMTAKDTSSVEVSNPVDFTSMTFATTGVNTSAMPIVAEATMKFGFTDLIVGLSSNLTLSLDAGSANNGENWNVYRKSAGESSWTLIDTCIVVNGLCDFETSQLSDFGGGSVFDSITTTTVTTTPPLDFNLNLELTPELRMTCPVGPISMGSIPGMTGGEANVNVDCNIATNNPDGYTMLIHSSSTGSGTALANTTSPDTHGFENHPVYSGGTFVGSYTNNPASSTFGFAITSADAPGYFSTIISTMCGSGTSATGQCWRGFDNTESTDIVIASKTSATTLSGVTTTMHFKSTIGSVSQTDVPIGDYQATIIVTGIQN